MFTIETVKESARQLRVRMQLEGCNSLAATITEIVPYATAQQRGRISSALHALHESKSVTYVRCLNVIAKSIGYTSYQALKAALSTGSVGADALSADARDEVVADAVWRNGVLSDTASSVADITNYLSYLRDCCDIPCDAVCGSGFSSYTKVSDSVLNTRLEDDVLNAQRLRALARPDIVSLLRRLDLMKTLDGTIEEDGRRGAAYILTSDIVGSDDLWIVLERNADIEQFVSYAKHFIDSQHNQSTSPIETTLREIVKSNSAIDVSGRRDMSGRRKRAHEKEENAFVYVTNEIDLFSNESISSAPLRINGHVNAQVEEQSKATTLNRFSYSFSRSASAMSSVFMSLIYGFDSVTIVFHGGSVLISRHPDILPLLPFSGKFADAKADDGKAFRSCLTVANLALQEAGFVVQDMEIQSSDSCIDVHGFRACVNMDGPWIYARAENVKRELLPFGLSVGRSKEGRETRTGSKRWTPQLIQDTSYGNALLHAIDGLSKCEGVAELSLMQMRAMNIIAAFVEASRDMDRLETSRNDGKEANSVKSPSLNDWMEKLSSIRNVCNELLTTASEGSKRTGDSIPSIPSYVDVEVLEVIMHKHIDSETLKAIIKFTESSIKLLERAISIPDGYWQVALRSRALFKMASECLPLSQSYYTVSSDVKFIIPGLPYEQAPCNLIGGIMEKDGKPWNKRRRTSYAGSVEGYLSENADMRSDEVFFSIGIRERHIRSIVKRIASEDVPVGTKAIILLQRGDGYGIGGDFDCYYRMISFEKLACSPD